MHGLVKGGDDRQELWRAANILEDLEEPTSAHQVKSFGEVHEGEEQWLLLLLKLLLQLTEEEDQVHCGPPGSEATLQAGQGDPSEDFANDVQKRDAAIVVAITMVTLVLVQGDYTVCWHLSCLGGCDLAPSTGRGAHEAVAGWFASHASKLPAG